MGAHPHEIAASTLPQGGLVPDPAWPHRAASRFLRHQGIEWHYQEFGASGLPAMVLVHGTGASSHSFAGLAPILAARHHVIAMDLPGHGFTRASGSFRFSLPEMASAVGGLLDCLQISPAAVCGHSAGAAILLSMADRGSIKPGHLIGINSALEPMPGHAILSPMAKLLHLSPFTSRFFTWQARNGGVGNLLKSTGSRIPPQSQRCYETLFSSRSHVDATIAMMANWHLQPLVERFASIGTDVTLIAALDDPMVSAAVSKRAARALGNATFVAVPAGGHLVHEADPEAIATLIADSMIEKEL